MEPRRFWIHLTIGLTLSMVLGIANLVRGGDAGLGNNEGRVGLPSDREASSPLRGPSTVPKHLPSTGPTDQTKPNQGTINKAKASEPSATDHESAAPSKHPSSHAEKHPDSDRMNADNKKTPDKETH